MVLQPEVTYHGRIALWDSSLTFATSKVVSLLVLSFYGIFIDIFLVSKFNEFFR